MKYKLDTREVIVDGAKKRTECKIQINAKAFELLARQYSNPIKAIIQELSANALDAQTRAGEKRPFQIHIPSSLDTTFYIRDFGTSMSEDVVYNVYTSYMNSDKSNSNSEIGMFGIGSKTPFAYVDSYWVITYLDGVETQYLMTKNEHHVPELIEFAKLDTKEPNGVKVSFNVNPRDISKFQAAAILVLQYFKEKPEVLNCESTKKQINNPSCHAFNDKLTLFKDNGSNYRYKSPIFVRMGNIVYDTGSAIGSIDNKYISVYDVPIGSLDVTPSREALEFTNKTIQYISLLEKQITKDIDAYITAEINKLTGTKYQKYLQAQKQVFQFVEKYHAERMVETKMKFEERETVEYFMYRYRINKKNAAVNTLSLGGHSLASNAWGGHTCVTFHHMENRNMLLVVCEDSDFSQDVVGIVPKVREKIKYFISSNQTGTTDLHIMTKANFDKLEAKFGVLGTSFETKCLIYSKDLPEVPKKPKGKRVVKKTTDCYNLITQTDGSLDQSDSSQYFVRMSEFNYFKNKISSALFPNNNVWALYANQIKKNHKMVELTDQIIDDAKQKYIEDVKKTISEQDIDTYLITQSVSSYYVSNNNHDYVIAYEKVYGNKVSDHKIDKQKMQTLLGFTTFSYSQKLKNEIEKRQRQYNQSIALSTIRSAIKNHFPGLESSIIPLLEKEINQ